MNGEVVHALLGEKHELYLSFYKTKHEAICTELRLFSRGYLSSVGSCRGCGDIANDCSVLAHDIKIEESSILHLDPLL